MALGALLLEGDNSEFWVALGCLSDHKALKQHALIRGLQLNVSLAVAWAYLGKVLSICITQFFFLVLLVFSWTFCMVSLLILISYGEIRKHKNTESFPCSLMGNSGSLMWLHLVYLLS